MASNLYEYYKGIGQPMPNLSVRAKMYESYGLGSSSGYAGTAQQNTALLGKLGGSGQASSAPTNPTNSPPKFNDSGEVQNYLNSRQNTNYQSGGMDTPSLDLGTIAKELKGLLPTTQTPTAPNMTGMYGNLREQYGLEALESEINDLKGQEDELNAQFRVNVTGEKSQPVAMGVIEGRIGEQENTYRENLDFVQRQISRKVDQAKSAYGVIDTLMNLTQRDFDNARATYNDEFDKAYKAISLVNSERDFRYNVIKQQQDVARANAQIMFNAIKEGNMTVTPEIALNLSKLELQSGLPVGFFNNLEMDADAKIVATTSDNGQIKVLTRGANGLELQTYGTKSTGSGSESYKQGSEGFRVAKGEMNTMLGNVTGQDGYVAPEAFRKGARDWSSGGFDIEDYYNEFRTYVNPSHAQDYGIPLKYISGESTS